MSDRKGTFYDKYHTPQMLTSIVANIFNYAVSRGLDANKIQIITGVTRKDLINPESRLPEELAATIWKMLGDAYPQQNLSLHMASATPLSQFFGQLSQIIQYADNLRSAIETLIQYRSIISDQLHLSLVESNSEAILQAYHPIDEIDGGYGIEAGLALLKRAFENVIGMQLPLVKVCFRHKSLVLPYIYEDYFQAPVVFHQQYNGFVFQRETLDLPTVQKDNYLFQYIQKNLDILQDYWHLNYQPSHLSQLYHAIHHNAQVADYSVNGLAKQLNISVRVLQRQANENGFTIKHILDNAREAKAKQLLMDRQLNLDTISMLLGYSDDRAFRRAFKRWTGLTPAQFRRDKKYS